MIIVLFQKCNCKNFINFCMSFVFAPPSPSPSQKWHECLVEFSPPCLHLTEYEDFRLEVRKIMKAKLINDLAQKLT